MNHAFIDRYKRAPFSLTTIFLRMNGFRLVVDADAPERFVIERLVGGHVPIDEIADWFGTQVERA